MAQRLKQLNTNMEAASQKMISAFGRGGGGAMVGISWAEMAGRGRAEHARDGERGEGVERGREEREESGRDGERVRGREERAHQEVSCSLCQALAMLLGQEGRFPACGVGQNSAKC